MRLRASPVLLGGASLLSMGMPGTRGLLPGPSAPHRLDQAPSSSRSHHRRSSAGCLCRRPMAAGCGCFSNTKSHTNTSPNNAHGRDDDAATTAPAAASATTAAVAPSMRTTCDPHIHQHHNRIHHQEEPAAAAGATASKTNSSVLRRKHGESQHQHHQHQQHQRPSKSRSEQFSRPRAVNRRHAGRGVLETSTSVGGTGGGGGGGGKAAAKALAAASRARRVGGAVRGGEVVELEVGGGSKEEEAGGRERRMGGVVGVGSHSAFQNLREVSAGVTNSSSGYNVIMSK